MKRNKKEIIIFSIFIVLFLSSIAVASYVDQIIKAATTVTTSAGAYRVGAQVVLDDVVTATLARQAMLTGATTAFWPIVGAAAAALGTFFLVTNMEDWVNWLKEQAGVYTPGKATGLVVYNLPGGKKLYVEPVGSGSCPYGGYVGVSGVVIHVGGTEGSPVITGWDATGTGPPCYSPVKYVPLHFWIDQHAGYHLYNVPVGGWSISVDTSWTPTTPITSNYPPATVNDTALAAAIAANPGKRNELSETTVETTEPAGGQDMGDIQGFAVQGGTGTENENEDFWTGQSTEPVEDPNADPAAEPDPFVFPGQPSVTSVNTDIEAPESKDIGGLISAWLSNAPFMNIIDNFEVSASNGACQFVIDLPFGDQTATMDFCEFEDLWAAIAAIVIAFAYVFSVMIIFKGN